MPPSGEAVRLRSGEHPSRACADDAVLIPRRPCSVGAAFQHSGEPEVMPERCRCAEARPGNERDDEMCVEDALVRRSRTNTQGGSHYRPRDSRVGAGHSAVRERERARPSPRLVGDGEMLLTCPSPFCPVSFHPPSPHTQAHFNTLPRLSNARAVASASGAREPNPPSLRRGSAVCSDRPMRTHDDRVSRFD